MHLKLLILLGWVCCGVFQPISERETSLYRSCSGSGDQSLWLQRTHYFELQTMKTNYGRMFEIQQIKINTMFGAIRKLKQRYRNLVKQLTELTRTTTPRPSESTRSPSVYAEQGQGSREQIAFYAAVSVDTETNPVVFDKVYLDEGGGYDNNTGEFTCGVGGVYQFTWAVEVFGEVDVGTMLEVKGQVHGYTWTDADIDQYDTSTSVVILRLDAGDVIRITLQAGSKVDARQSAFTGHFLFP